LERVQGKGRIVTPVARTKQHIAKHGLGIVDTVERPVIGPGGRMIARKDLYGLGDLLLTNPNYTALLQVTSDSNRSSRVKKAWANENLKPWLLGPGRRFLVITWGKHGKPARWQPHLTEALLSKEWGVYWETGRTL
jgi:hypothetical protein